MMPRLRGMLFPTIALLSLTGCAKQTDFAEPSLSAACFAFQPIVPTASDDTLTLKQILEHNSAWDAICNGG